MELTTMGWILLGVGFAPWRISVQRVNRRQGKRTQHWHNILESQCSSTTPSEARQQRNQLPPSTGRQSDLCATTSVDCVRACANQNLSRPIIMILACVGPDRRAVLEVKDAHDRYANIEVGYLLQKMEEYDGVVILATNLLNNLDDAFVRRLHMTIDFPFPEEAYRRQIWARVFPAEAPLAADIDLALLARQFRLAGGNIRNVALLAAFLAAEDGSTIGMGQVMRAIRREYQKIGKLVTETEFGRWVSLVQK